MQTTVDKKVLDRVRKLLALAADGGATEGEAASAAEFARKIMAENGISNATIEAGGGQGEGRTKDGSTGRTGKRWMRDIMEALARSSFVTTDWHPGYRGRAGRWELWGRESAVVTVKLMHEYLVRTVDRVARERGSPTDELFKEAMGDRIAQRLAERHDTAMAAQKREAEAQPQPSASPGSNSLVVVLEDYAQKERDLNDDLRNGLEPGETERRRLQRNMEYQQRVAEREQKRAALFAEGLSELIVDLIMQGFTRDRAEALAAEQPEPQVESEKARKKRHEEYQRWEERNRRHQEKQAARRGSPSYRAGRIAGDSVGLDTQVGQAETKKIN